MKLICKIKKNARETFTDIFLVISLILIIMIMLFHQQIYSDGIRHGFLFCINILVPSIFPFMFLSSFIIKSPIINSIGRIFSGITKFLFYLPGCTAPAIILGLIGGYPTGAKIVQNLFEQNLINEEQANRLICFNIGAGPAFIISVAGGILLKDRKAGIVIFICQILLSLIIGITLGIHARINKKELFENQISAIRHSNISISIINSCQDAVNSTISMCSLIIIFYSFLSIANEFIQKYADIFPPLVYKIIIPIMLEVNSACVSISNNLKSPILITFAISWGGMCVHLQIISIISQIKSIGILKFIIFRFIHAFGSAFLVYIATHTIYPLSVQIFSSTQEAVTPGVSSSLCGSFSLIILCLYFINNLINIKNT